METKHLLNKLLDILYDTNISINHERIEGDASTKYISEQLLAKMLNISDRRLNALLKILKDANYLDAVFYKGENNIDYAWLTEFGKMFKENGGYIEQERRKTSKATLDIVLAWALAGGTVLVGIVELVRLYLEMVRCHCH